MVLPCSISRRYCWCSDLFCSYEKLAKHFVCDFIIEDVVVVELKALSQLGDVEKAQILNYLKATRLPVGLLLNFGTRSLEYKRFANTKSA